MFNELVILSGRSGVGKSTLQNLLCRDKKFHKLITTTTRSPRTTEIDGKDYYFLSNSKFDLTEFVFTSEIFGKSYGLELKECQRVSRTTHIPVIVAAPNDLEALINISARHILVHLTSTNFEQLALDRSQASDRMTNRSIDEINFLGSINSYQNVVTLLVDGKTVEEIMVELLTLLEKGGIYV